MPESQQPLEGQNIMLHDIFAEPCHIFILDVGAGDGRWGKLLRKNKPEYVMIERLDAIEIWQPYIDRYRLEDLYDKVVCVDAVEFQGWDEYNVIILGDVLEHLHRADALKLIEMLKEKKVKIFLTVPITPCVQDGRVYGNPYETHRDQWTHEELEAQGWKQLHQGLNPNGKVTIGTYVLNREEIE